MAGDPTVMTLSGDLIVEEARKRFDRCSEWEGNARQKFLDDVRFANGDSENGYQWPNAIRRTRDVDNRPCLTLNVINQHNLMITNAGRQNKSAIKLLATGGSASVESAKVMQAIVQEIERRSNAQDCAYQMARTFQVEGGVGWWRIITAYASDETMDQEIWIREIQDPLSVYGDPDCQQSDGSDAKFGLVFDTVPRDDFDESYPDMIDEANQQPLGVGSIDSDWIAKDYIRLCEYFRVVKGKDTLVSFFDPTSGMRKEIWKSLLSKALTSREMLDEVMKAKSTRTRAITPQKVEWYLIAGQRIIDKTIWPGKYVPLIRVLGKQTQIDGQLDRKGHTRYMKDAQRMYNYNGSAQVEFVALQGKTPWVAPVKAIEELEQYWNTANQTNHSILPYNHVDDDRPDQVIPPPTRTQPPTAAPAYEQGMKTAFDQMMMTSGQWQNQMGMGGNERTGAAISERQEQGDTATFHFQDNFACGLKFCARQLIDLIPKVMNRQRIMKVLADDGSMMDLIIDPTQKQALQVQQAQTAGALVRIFNPQVGQYDVAEDVGKAFGTRRQESAESLKLLLTQAPALTGLIGDLLLKCLDFDEAQEAAQRMKRMVPPQALGVGPSPEVQHLQQQLQGMQVALSKALQRAGKDSLKLVGKSEMRDIDVYDAETKRFAALSKLLADGDPEGIKQTIEQLVEDALSTRLGSIIQANKSAIAEQGGEDEGLPEGGASPQQAGDGEWYLRDPSRQGRYLRLAPLAQQHTSREIVGSG